MCGKDCFGGKTGFSFASAISQKPSTLVPDTVNFVAVQGGIFFVNGRPYQFIADQIYSVLKEDVAALDALGVIKSE